MLYNGNHVLSLVLVVRLFFPKTWFSLISQVFKDACIFKKISNQLLIDWGRQIICKSKAVFEVTRILFPEVTGRKWPEPEISETSYLVEVPLTQAQLVF